MCHTSGRRKNILVEFEKWKIDEKSFFFVKKHCLILFDNFRFLIENNIKKIVVMRNMKIFITVRCHKVVEF